MTGSLFKTLIAVVMVKDSKSYFALEMFNTGQLNSMLEPYHIFNGWTPHLYQDGNMSNPASFRRAESVYFLEKFE